MRSGKTNFVLEFFSSPSVCICLLSMLVSAIYGGGSSTIHLAVVVVVLVWRGRRTGGSSWSAGSSSQFCSDQTLWGGSSCRHHWDWLDFIAKEANERMIRPIQIVVQTITEERAVDQLRTTWRIRRPNWIWAVWWRPLRRKVGLSSLQFAWQKKRLNSQWIESTSSWSSTWRSYKSIFVPNN